MKRITILLTLLVFAFGFAQEPTVSQATISTQGYDEGVQNATPEMAIGDDGELHVTNHTPTPIFRMPTTLTTLFAGGNGGANGGAVYFDVTVGAADITITDLETNTGEAGAFTMDVYAVVGTYVGNEDNAAFWGSPVAVASGTGMGANVPSPTTLDVPLVLTANTTYAMALVMDASHAHDYTNGDGTNQQYSNADLTIDLGSGSNVPFTPTIFNPRVWNGSITYDLGGGGGGNPCAQGNPINTPAGGVGSSIDSAFDSAVDVIVPMDENFTLEKVTANFLTFPADGAPVVADVYYYTNAGGFPDMEIGSETGIPVTVLNSMPWVNPVIDVHTLEFDVTPFEFAGQLGADTTYWIKVLMGTSTMSGSVFFEVTNTATTPLVGEPLVQFDGTVWGYPDFGSGPDPTTEGVYSLDGQCEAIPDNDDCAGAFAIACGETMSGDTSNGNTDTNGDGSPDEWHAFTSTVAGEFVTVSTCNQAAYDTILTVYDSCGGTVVASNDDGPGCSGFTSELTFQADGSSTYYIAVDGFGGGSGTYDLTITCTPPAANDTCENAIAIDCGSVTAGSTTFASIDDAVASNCEDTFDPTPFNPTVDVTAPGVWYTFTDPSGLVSDIRVSTCDDATFDTKISVYEGDCTGGLICVAANDDDDDCTGFTSTVEWVSDGSTTYYILVHGFGSSTGDFNLTLECTPVPPPNDMIVNSIDVDEIGVPYTDPAVAMPAATVENGNPVGCDISGGKGVWYNFTPQGNGTATAEIVSPAGNSFVVFFTAPDENAIETDLEYFFQIGNQCAPGTVATINTAAGQPYYVYVVNDGGVTDITIDGVRLGTNDNVIEGFSFYPNPTNGMLNLDSIDAIEDVAIYNLLGQQVLGQEVNATSAQFDTSTLATGAYLMKVTVDGQTGTYKVIKR
ncbi:T9SS type A sorting domain-containing protein [Aureitalea sp. L0-47]|uniref:T9SS type A sorting domain-containing protein n=1 Tax=Aureitalea sp. L0-47 TaxID=2816962 RepID=UPI002237CAA6|nr:T9SS type A sorting domain-containing protein [Aureitalea sp. L0-47]MCW5519641.1 T9SS type A sorting domain-containing protein [Aureitalea sp. L0-47]